MFRNTKAKIEIQRVLFVGRVVGEEKEEKGEEKVELDKEDKRDEKKKK